MLHNGVLIGIRPPTHTTCSERTRTRALESNLFETYQDTLLAKIVDGRHSQIFWWAESLNIEHQTQFGGPSKQLFDPLGICDFDGGYTEVFRPRNNTSIRARPPCGCSCGSPRLRLGRHSRPYFSFFLTHPCSRAPI